MIFSSYFKQYNLRPNEVNDCVGEVQIGVGEVDVGESILSWMALVQKWTLIINIDDHENISSLSLASNRKTLKNIQSSRSIHIFATCPIFWNENPIKCLY